MNLEKRSSPLVLTKMIWNDREQKPYFLIGCALILVQVILFKFLYPFPNFLPDSYSYIDAASANDAVNTWPIGYSKFIRLVSVFTTSHLALVIIQYLILVFSVMYFLYSVTFLFDPGKWVFRILLLLNICNPLLLYISNFVSSDSLFASLSLIWFTQLAYILYSPGKRLLLAHALIVFAVFIVRYNAIYFPLISLVVVCWTRNKPSRKLLFAGVVSLLVGLFILDTSYTYKSRIGKAQFSPFAGWQLASNALFAYGHVPKEDRKPAPAQFKDLQAVVDKEMDSLDRLRERPDAELGIYYLWNESSPLTKYTHRQKLRDTAHVLGKGWGDLGPLYSAYGYHLIKQYPAAYLGHYILPNLVNYYVPEAEFLSVQNMGLPTIDEKGAAWFKLKDRKVHGYFSDSQIRVTQYFPYLFAAINVFFVLSLIGFLLTSGAYKKTPFRRFISLCLLVWFCNVIFSVAASPIVLRYQLFPMIITSLFTVLLLKNIYDKSFNLLVADRVITRMPAPLPGHEDGVRG